MRICKIRSKRKIRRKDQRKDQRRKELSKILLVQNQIQVVLVRDWRVAIVTIMAIIKKVTVVIGAQLINIGQNLEKKWIKSTINMD